MNTKLHLAPAALAATLLAALALALGPAVAAGAAPAQEGDAELTVEAHPADGGVHFIVLLTQGGDPVNGATVLATPATADGDQLAPVTLEPSDTGEYQGFVSFPAAGTWTVQIASDDPAASVVKTVDVAVSPSTSGPPAGSNGGEGFTPAQDDAGTSAESDDGGGPPIALIAGLAVPVLAGAAAAVVVTRRRQAAATPAPPTPRAPQRKAKTTAQPEAATEAEPEAAQEAAPEAAAEAAPEATTEAEESENADEGEGGTPEADDGGAADPGKVEAT